MFRKAKRLSKRLGINKDKCVEHTTSYNKSYTSISEPSSPTLTSSATKTSSSEDYYDSESNSSTSSTSDHSHQKNPVEETRRPGLTKCSTEPNKRISYEHNKQMGDTGNLDLLLAMETQSRMEAQAKREEEQLEKLQLQQTMSAPRPTKIKFELPVTPPRSRSPTNPRLQYPRAGPVRSLPEEGLTANALRNPLKNNSKNRRAGWRHLFGDRDEDETKNIPLPILVGSRVKLKLRPLPTFGYVRFIGEVEPEHEIYIGVELDHGGKKKKNIVKFIYSQIESNISFYSW